MSCVRLTRGVAALAFLWACPPTALAQPGGRIVGQALFADGQPAAGATVRLETLPDRPPVVVKSDGTFVMDAVAPGTQVVVAHGEDGHSEGRSSVAVVAGRDVHVDIVLQLAFSEDVVVSESRAGQLRHEVPASIGTVTSDELERVRPSHPSEILGTVPGVWVGITGGEGHQTAIRQPLTTSPVYLYLEDGVPTRSAGFFNHNALYEINVPDAQGIEVTRGPGSALYGSDAIGGVINVLTRSSLERSGVSATIEGGGDGWKRALADANWSRGTQGVRVALNLTDSDGWRRATGYNRQGGTLRWDWLRGTALTKTLLSVNRIDQESAGSSVLSEIDYLTDPSANLTPISFRDVTAIRLSVDHQRMAGAAMLSVVPYYRYDSMGLLPNWSLTYDPTAYTTDNQSVGVLAKLQRDVTAWRTSLIAGVDADWSPGEHVEDIVRPVMSSSDLPSGRQIFADYSRGNRIYDYAVTFFSVSPYVQAEFSPVSRLRVTAGVRADHMAYDYDDRLTTPDTARHRRPDDASRSFTHVSPKLGVTWQLTPSSSVFGSYRHAFRAPSEGQLFRQGSARNTIDLAPVRADNFEAGLRVAAGASVSFDVSVYDLEKRDDILTYRDPVDGLTTSVNAGRTRHRGIEAGVEWSTRRWGVRGAYSYARHTYEDWVVDPAAGIDLSGFEQESAPHHLGSASARVSPIERFVAAADVSVLGAYWMDAANTTRYGGHTLVNLRGQFEVTTGVRAFVKALNVLDRRYAESATYTLSRGRELAPGRPRTVMAGVELDWRK